MVDVFIQKLILSFIVGSVWITLTTILAERYGTKIGGVIAGLPSTILIALFFIGWTQSPSVAVAATSIVPIVGGINCLFIVAYIYLVKINFWLSLVGSLLLWSVLSFGLVIIRFDNFILSLIAYAVLLFLCYNILEKKLVVKSKPGKKIKYTFSILLFRGLFSGLIISLAVIMGKIGGPLFGGMFAMFPAMFLGTLVITYFTHGALFSSAVMKVSTLAGMSIIVYGIMVRYTYLPLGLLAGTGVSILVAFGSAYLIHYSVIRRMV